MNDRLIIFDTTLRDGEQSPGASMTCSEKLQIAQQLDVEAKYSGYIDRQEREIASQAKQESLMLPEDLNYKEIQGLSNESRQRLIEARPKTLGQASRLEGMTSSAVSLILIYLKKRQLKKSA